VSKIVFCFFGTLIVVEFRSEEKKLKISSRRQVFQLIT